MFSGQKIKFCVKWSKRVQMIPKWPQMVKNMLYWSFGIILAPLRPLWDIGKPAMFGHFWSQKGLFGPPCAQDWRMAMAETTSNQLPICLGIRHIYGHHNQKCDEQGWKRFGLKTRYNGRVIAREVYFYQCVPSLVAPGDLEGPLHPTQNLLQHWWNWKRIFSIC